MTEANPGRKGKDLLIRGLTVREVATMDEHAQIEGISRNAFMVRALEERVARQLVDREIRVLFFGVKALRKRLKEQYPEI